MANEALATSPGGASFLHQCDGVNFSSAVKPEMAAAIPLQPSCQERAQASVVEPRAQVFGKVQCVCPSSVENITSAELEEIRSFKHPPHLVQRALEATCLLLSAAQPRRLLKSPDWATVQNMLTDAKFLARILTYDVQTLQAAPELLAYVRMEYFELPAEGKAGLHEALSLERVLRANRATGALFSWSSAIVNIAVSAPPSANLVPSLECPTLPTGHDSEPIVLQKAQASVELAVLESAPLEAKVSRMQLRPDRHFETSVPSLSYSMATSITMEVIEEVANARPNLRLELSACMDPIEGPQKTTERLQNVNNFLASKGIECRLNKGMDKASARREAGITCAVHLNDDVELIRYLRICRERNNSSVSDPETAEDLSPEHEELKSIVERLEEWFETRMHF